MALSHYQEAGLHFKQSQSLTKRTRVKFVLLEATAFVKAGKFIFAPTKIFNFCEPIDMLKTSEGSYIL